MSSIACHGFNRHRVIVLSRLAHSVLRISRQSSLSSHSQSQSIDNNLNVLRNGSSAYFGGILSRAFSYRTNLILHRMSVSNVAKTNIKVSNTNTKMLNDPALDSLLQLRFSYITTSTERWVEYPGGLQFDCGFVDSMPGSEFSPRIPVIVGLPGCVGNHRELAKLLLIFVKLGYRVIIPNMPGSLLCKGRSRADLSIFTFTVDEKAEFVKNFLSELNIPKVDMLVTNSCSVYAGVELCLRNVDMFKGLAMINPTGLDLTPEMKPLVIHQILAYMWERMLDPFVSAVVLVGKWFTKKRSLSVDEIMTYSKTVVSLSDKDAYDNAKDFNLRDIPRLAIYSDDSNDLDRDSTEEMLKLMGIPKSSITVYDENQNIINTGTPNNKNYGVLFQGNIGDIKEMQPGLIKKRLWDFFKTIRPDL